MKKFLGTIAVGCAALTAAPAMAATFTIADGATICESDGFGQAAGACDATNTFADIGNSPVNPDTVSFAGSGTLLGYVVDAAGIDETKWPDFAIVTLPKKSSVHFSLYSGSSAFAGTFGFGSVMADLTQDLTPVSFVVEAGQHLFFVNAAIPDSLTREAAAYALNVSAVPLPAGMVLVLTGMGGFALMRRKAA